MKNTLRLSVAALLVLSACAPGGPTNQLPNDWYLTNEADENSDDALTEPTPELEESVNDLFGSTYDGLDQINESNRADFQSAMTGRSGKPKDWVPWHLAAMMAEFSVSVKGLIGALIMKGQPAVVASWRKQNPKQPERSMLDPQMAVDLTAADAVASEHTTEEDLMRQLEPAVRAAVASKRVKNENALRKNLGKAAGEFLTVARVLQKTEGREWWLQRYRLDLTFDLSGKVTAVIGAGAETRLRMEWHRIMPKAASSGVAAPVAFANDREQRIYAFADGMLKSLEAAGREFRAVSDHGFKAHTFRVGVGFTAEGDIGIVKTGSSITGHVYFTSNVKKPSVNPTPRPFAAMIDVSGLDLNVPEVTPLIAENRVRFVDGKKFVKGLKKAAKLGGFFAKRASKSKSGKWKIFEIKTSFDLSLSGKVGLATVGGVGTAEINFYNMNF